MFTRQEIAMQNAEWITLFRQVPPDMHPQTVLVLNNRQDALFTMPEMERADRILSEVYKKAGAPERYRASFYDGPHKFDREMQKEAFAWFDRWLKG